MTFHEGMNVVERNLIEAQTDYVIRRHENVILSENEIVSTSERLRS